MYSERMPSYLALADADRGQDYVFGPPQLRYVRGGRRLEDDALEGNKRLFPGGEKIFANGGLALGEFAGDARAAEFCRGCEDVFRRLTKSASVSTAFVEQTEPGDEGFKEAWKRARDAVERKKRQQNELMRTGAHW